MSDQATFGRTLARDSARRYPRTSLAELPSLPSVDVLPEALPEAPEQPPRSPEQTYVEFDLSHKDVSTDDILKRFTLPEPAPDAVAEEPLPPAAPPERKEDFFAAGDGWQTMKKVTQENYYDESGNLEFSRDRGFDMFSTGKERGYTKIDTEEQLNKYAELDKKTDFLFEVLSDKADVGESDEEYDAGDDNIDSDETLVGTKGMLTESQKFAYIGIVKLISVDMATELATLNQRTATRTAKKLATSQKNFANWTLYIMSKLVDHLEISKDEKTMIENLSAHGVEVADLTRSLLLADIRQPKLEKLTKDFDLRWVLVCDLFLLLLSDGYYDSRSRTLLVKFATYLGIAPLEIRQFERRLVENLEMDTSNKTIENKDEKMRDRLFIEKHIQKNRTRRLTYIGLATLGGSLAIGLSAGLLAPVIGAGLAAGLTTVGISGTGGFLAGVGGSVAITTGGVAIGAKVGNKAGSRRVGDVQTFEMKALHNNKRSNLIITVSGWMNGEMDDVRLPFSTVDPVMGDMFSLLWEPEMLKSMGQTIGILASEALSTSIQQILGATILTALMSAIQLPMALSKLSYLLDNPWNVSLDRAWKAGKILADTLVSGNMGVRPITLVGFSLGLRLIYSCLIELANRGGYGLVENVILLGNPVTVKHDQITLARSVVSGRFVNGYIKNDWILGYLFRATGGGLLTVAGISPIDKIPGVENFDCTEYVEGHMSYRKAIPKIMKALDWEVLSEEFAEIEEPDLEQRERQRQLISEFDEARAKMEKEKQEQMTRERTWKDWFRPQKKNWWELFDESRKDEGHGDAATGEFEEYDVGDQKAAPEAIFNVDALMEEVKDIEKVSEQPPEELEKVRAEVEPQPELHTNEEVDEEKPTVLDTLSSKLNPLKTTQ